MVTEPICNFQQLVTDLRSTFDANNFVIDKQDFYNFVAESGYPEYYRLRFGKYYIEKLLEHYVSIKLSKFRKDDVFIDIAADQSYFADYISKTYDIEAYRQDIIYRKGIFSSPSVPLVGGDAAILPFRDNYISRMTLHCSLEHFEGDSDILFLQEAERVLKDGGKCVILPLYLGEEYHFVTDPKIKIVQYFRPM